MAAHIFMSVFDVCVGCMNTVKHKPGLQLQYLLQGGSYRKTKLRKYNSLESIFGYCTMLNILLSSWSIEFED